MKLKFNAFCKKLSQGGYNILENNKRKIILDIAGNKIAVVTDENEVYVKKLAALITQRVGAISASGAAKTDAALLLALDLLDENFKLKMKLSEMQNGYVG
jgi:cell division protein ZapA (FtsZ GTPase activity inhibitor)